MRGVQEIPVDKADMQKRFERVRIKKNSAGEVKAFLNNINKKLLKGEEITLDDAKFVEENKELINRNKQLKLLRDRVEVNYRNAENNRYGSLREDLASSSGEKLNIIFLMGVSASGKTVTGKEISKILGGEFHDFDDSLPWVLNKEWTAEKGYKPGSEKFGEIYHNDIVSRVKAMVGRRTKTIVMCGFSSKKQLEEIASDACGEKLFNIHTFSLNCTKEEHELRMEKRIADGQQLAPEHLQELEKFQEKAKEMGASVVDTTGKSINAVAKSIVESVIVET